MTRNQIQLELFDELKELAAAIPEMRVGQLVAAIGELCADMHGRGLWDATDQELREAVWAFRRNFEESVTSSRDGMDAVPGS
jgi:hypothetical protein